MKVLVIAKQKKNVDTFEGVLAGLLALGHEVTLAIQQRDPERDERLVDRLRHERFALVPCPEERTDGWRAAEGAGSFPPKVASDLAAARICGATRSRS